MTITWAVFDAHVSAGMFKFLQIWDIVSQWFSIGYALCKIDAAPLPSVRVTAQPYIVR